MSTKLNVLTLAQFLKLKGKQKSPVVVHFNASQWANLTRDLKPGRGKPPAKTLTLTLTEIPGLAGGLATFGCPIECSGPIRGGEGEVRCDCGGSITPPGGGGETTLEFCFMIVSKDGSVSCRGKCRNENRSCRLASWFIPSAAGSRLVVATCNCG